MLRGEEVAGLGGEEVAGLGGEEVTRLGGGRAGTAGGNNAGRRGGGRAGRGGGGRAELLSPTCSRRLGCNSSPREVPTRAGILLAPLWDGSHRVWLAPPCPHILLRSHLSFGFLSGQKCPVTWGQWEGHSTAQAGLHGTTGGCQPPTVPSGAVVRSWHSASPRNSRELLSKAVGARQEALTGPSCPWNC